jgi:hypothetical protein
MERQISRVYPRNPFVLSALELIEQHREQDIDIRELSALLGEREPKLSPRNLQCAAREAIRRSRDGWFTRAEETRRNEAAREAAVESEMAGIHSDGVDEEAASYECAR